VRAASSEKWLEVHGIEHWTEFYMDYGVDLQKRFFGHFLKGEATGWEKQPRIFGGQVTLHAGGGKDAYLLLPVVPKR